MLIMKRIKAACQDVGDCLDLSLRAPRVQSVSSARL